MKRITGSAVLLALAFLSAPHVVAQQSAGNPQQLAPTGIYTSGSDFTAQKLSYTSTPGTASSSRQESIRLHDLFGSATLTIVQNGNKQVLAKDEVYGFRKQGQDYRVYRRAAYLILSNQSFFLYSYNKLVQGDKIARPATLYYFSTDADAEILPLTRENLQQAFASNTRFRYLLDANIRSEKDLITYDPALKTYKLDYLYKQSLKND